MKNLSIISAFTVVMLVAAQSFGQQVNNDIKDVLTNRSLMVTWLGADFSHVIIEDMPDCSPQEFATSYVPQINTVVVNEPNKYDFAKFLNKAGFTNSIGAVSKSNAAINPSNMVPKDGQPGQLNETIIAEIVSGYDLKDKEGVGVVLVYESLSKSKLLATMFLTYVKMPEGKVILTKRVTGKPKGFGLRNYWAYTVYDFLKDYDKTYEKPWKAEYGLK